MGRDRIAEQDIGAGDDLQMEIRRAGRLRTTRIHHDDFNIRIRFLVLLQAAELPCLPPIRIPTLTSIAPIFAPHFVLVPAVAAPFQPTKLPPSN